MTAYLLFAGPNYYASGGAGDFISAHETLEDAQAAVPKERIDRTFFSDGFDDPLMEDVQWAHVAAWDGHTLTPICYASVPMTYSPGTPLQWRDDQ